MPTLFMFAYVRENPTTHMDLSLEERGLFLLLLTKEQLQIQFKKEIEEGNQYYNKICNECQTESDETD